MPFTGRLGTPDSQLGNIELGSAGGSGSNRTTQNLQLKANILNRSSQSLQMQARIQKPGTQSLQLKARISPGLSLKARITGLVTGDLEVDYSVLGAATADLLVIYNVSSATKSIQSLQMRARVEPALSAALSVSFDICFGMPTPPVVRPTQRTEFRTLRGLSMRAHIQTCTVVLQNGVYTRVCG